MYNRLKRCDSGDDAHDGQCDVNAKVCATEVCNRIGACFGCAPSARRAINPAPLTVRVSHVR